MIPEEFTSRLFAKLSATSPIAYGGIAVSSNPVSDGKNITSKGKSEKTGANIKLICDGKIQN